MAQFIDRRLNGKNKSAVNRQRFLRRHKEQIKESVADAVNRRSITNTETGEDVTIPHKDIKELISKYKIIGASAGSLFVFKGVYRAVLINYPNKIEKEKLIAF